jgi:hypothetical protein
MVTSCRKDVPKPDKYKYPPADSCADAIYRYSSPSTWPERNWECDTGCIIGCEFNESARAYNYHMPAFNQSNPYQIVFYRLSNTSSEMGTYTFDFCTGKLRAMVTNDAYVMDWGYNNLLLYPKSDGYMYTVKPNGDSAIRRSYSGYVGMGPFWSPSNYFIVSSGSHFKEIDINNNIISTFSLSPRYDRINWVDDNTITFVTHAARRDTLHTMNLTSGNITDVCLHTTIWRYGLYVKDTLPIQLCYNPNNNSIYWTSLGYIAKVDLITKQKTIIRKCYSSLHFKEFDYSPAIGKFILVGEEINKKYPAAVRRIIPST